MKVVRNITTILVGLSFATVVALGDVRFAIWALSLAWYFGVVAVIRWFEEFEVVVAGEEKESNP